MLQESKHDKEISLVWNITTEYFIKFRKYRHDERDTMMKTTTFFLEYVSLY